MEVSVVTTLYRSEEYLEEFYKRASSAAKHISEDYEIILVNDGSPDKSLDSAINLFEIDKHIKIIDLSRNFGQHKAFMTGLIHSRGRLIFLLDSDLEEEPELLDIFYEKMKETGADVVYGVQHSRGGGLVEKFSGKIFFFVFNLLSDYPVPQNIVHARLMSRRYVNQLLKHQDRELYIPGLMAMTGFDQVGVEIVKHRRWVSSYTLHRKIALMFNALTSSSSKPLYFILILGILILLINLFVGIIIILGSMFFDQVVNKFFWLISSFWFLGGLIILCLGIIGVYISKIFIEIKPRPFTIIRQVYEWNAPDGIGDKAA